MTAVLHILMRNDMASMNAGKGMAQASHASNAFVHHFHRFSQEVNARPVNVGESLKTITGFNEWENSTRQGFGTVLVLEAKMKDVNPVIDVFKALDYIAGVVHDPTYPLVDGEVVHYIPIDTCAYVFVPNKEEDETAKVLLQKFSLHR
jgi:hypothetical protein